LLPNFPPPHANRGFLVVHTNHSAPDAGDVTAHNALTKRILSRTPTTHWPVSKHRPERMVVTGLRPEAQDLSQNSFYSSYLSFHSVFLNNVFSDFAFQIK
jgi:hypothetical protein